MVATVTVRVSTHQRGINMLPRLTLLLSEAMQVEDMAVTCGLLGSYALYTGHTEASLAQFTAHLYGSPLEALIRDVSYRVNAPMPLTDLQHRNKELLEQTDTDYN